MKIPSRTELVGRIADLVPVLQKNAIWADENRQLHEETIEVLAGAGLLKMRVPRRYGGFESDMRTVVEVIAEVARGDGSAGWVASVWAISSWMVGLFPDEVQDEIFATPDVRVTGILSPGAVVVPTDGGYVLNGKWSFNSGAGQSHWNTNACVRPTSDGGDEPVMVAVPLTDLEVVDDWYTAGLRGTGSITTSARDVFVPEARAKIRLDLGVVCLRAKEAVDIFNTASGASSIYSSVPIQRIQRDVQTVNLHAILNPNTNFELFGRVVCGLEPHTPYI